VQAYLELLRERLDRPMRLALSVPAQWMDIAILPGALLCLAENAVKHALPEDGAELVLQIGAVHENNLLRISVQDNGAGLQGRAPAQSTGTGLRNLRERLRLSYGDDAALHLQDNGCGCTASLELPWETQ
jgi:LytS/YehU family sensor histidine kinase